MARPRTPTLTDGELRLMQVLWDRGEASVADVVAALPGSRKRAYNTVLTLMRILETKGYVRHTKVGRAFVFAPLLDRQHAQRHALSSLVDRFFQGSPRLLMLNLLESQTLSPAVVQELKRRLQGAVQADD